MTQFGTEWALSALGGAILWMLLGHQVRLILLRREQIRRRTHD